MCLCSEGKVDFKKNLLAWNFFEFLFVMRVSAQEFWALVWLDN